jgi:hypothetical protein
MLGQSKEVTIHGIPPITISNKTELLSVTAFGKCVQNGTPTPDNPVDIVCNNGVLKVDNQGNVYTYGTVETIEDTIGNTATAEMLLKVGDYQDVQNILSGVVMRNMMVKVFDGTEDWSITPTVYADRTRRIYTNYLGYNSLVYNSLGISTHFVEASLTDRDLQTGQQGKMYHSTTSFHLRATQFTSLNAAKQWLADQYAAGTPVIVIYPLATPTIESVAGQTLALTSGTNIIDITQASLQGLELEVKVK